MAVSMKVMMIMELEKNYKFSTVKVFGQHPVIDVITADNFAANVKAKFTW